MDAQKFVDKYRYLYQRIGFGIFSIPVYQSRHCFLRLQAGFGGLEDRSLGTIGGSCFYCIGDYLIISSVLCVFRSMLHLRLVEMINAAFCNCYIAVRLIILCMVLPATLNS